MDETPDPLLRDLDRATRIIGGLTDPQSRQALSDYIAELEARQAETRRQARKLL